MSERFNAKELTVEELRSFKGLDVLNEEEALEVIHAIEQFAALTFELIGNKKEERT
jgi:hypothetical protein